MSIIVMQSAQDGLVNNIDAVADKTVKQDRPPLLNTGSYIGTGSLPLKRFYHDLAVNPSGYAGVYYFKQCRDANGAARDLSWGALPAGSKEFWLRTSALLTGSGNGSVYFAYSTDIILIEFWNWNGTRMKKVADIVCGGYGYSPQGAVQYRLFSPVEGNNTVIRTFSLGTIANFLTYDATSKEATYDIRFVFDKHAGFVQFYDYTTTRVAEVIGGTVDDLVPTHVGVPPVGFSGINNGEVVPLFQIFADEPTFGMYVMPMHAKTNGSFAEQDSGGYTQFDKNYSNYVNRNVPYIKKDPDRIKKSSFVFQNATDKALPANYNILALEARVAFDITKMDLGALSVDGFLKFVDTGVEYSEPLRGVQPNVNSFTTLTPNISAMRFDKNPASGNSWQQGDLANIELGFSF